MISKYLIVVKHEAIISLIHSYDYGVSEKTFFWNKISDQKMQSFIILFILHTRCKNKYDLKSFETHTSSIVYTNRQFEYYFRIGIIIRLFIGPTAKPINNETYNIIILSIKLR